MASLDEKMKGIILSQGIMSVNWKTWENEDFKVIFTTKISLLQHLDQKEIELFLCDSILQDP